MTTATLRHATPDPPPADLALFPPISVPSEYERERNQATIAALPRASYGRAFQPGCSRGELTAQLAPRCIQVVATDRLPHFVARTRQRCSPFQNVDVHQASLTEGLPPGTFDLIVLSDFGGYFQPASLIQIVMKMVDRLQLGGEIVAAHSLIPGANRLLYGDAVHYLLEARLPLDCIHSERHDEFRIDLWKRLPQSTI
jgi:hypothetical protein